MNHYRTECTSGKHMAALMLWCMLWPACLFMEQTVDVNNTNTCTSPPVCSMLKPAPKCEGDRAVQTSEVLDKDACVCEQVSEVVDCAKDGLVCVDGACVPVVCPEVDCAAPAKTCSEDGSSVLTPVLSSDACCSFEWDEQPCEEGITHCKEGACVDLCQDITCTPGQVCVAGVCSCAGPMTPWSIQSVEINQGEDYTPSVAHPPVLVPLILADRVCLVESLDCKDGVRLDYASNLPHFVAAFKTKWPRNYAIQVLDEHGRVLDEKDLRVPEKYKDYSIAGIKIQQTPFATSGSVKLVLALNPPRLNGRLIDAAVLLVQEYVIEGKGKFSPVSHDPAVSLYPEHEIVALDTTWMSLSRDEELSINAPKLRASVVALALKGKDTYDVALEIDVAEGLKATSRLSSKHEVVAHSTNILPKTLSIAGGLIQDDRVGTQHGLGIAFMTSDAVTHMQHVRFGHVPVLVPELNRLVPVDAGNEKLNTIEVVSYKRPNTVETPFQKVIVQSNVLANAGQPEWSILGIFPDFTGPQSESKMVAISVKAQEVLDARTLVRTVLLRRANAFGFGLTATETMGKQHAFVSWVEMPWNNGTLLKDRSLFFADVLNPQEPVLSLDMDGDVGAIHIAPGTRGVGLLSHQKDKHVFYSIQHLEDPMCLVAD